jgi:hypothetical protein
MKSIFFIPILSALLLTPLAGHTKEAPKSKGDYEINTVTRLVTLTKKNLLSQEELLSQLKLYKEARKGYTKDQKNKKRAKAMVTLADSLLKQITHSSIEHLFTSDFIEELNFFAQFSEESTSFST